MVGNDRSLFSAVVHGAFSSCRPLYDSYEHTAMEDANHDIARTFRTEVRTLFVLGSAGIMLSSLVSASAHAAGISQPHAFEEPSLGSADLPERPSVPVLTVSAGVLPTSPLAVLDRFDEWAQRNVFSFGVRRLRAQSALLAAAERVAELQVLESQGLRTAALDTRLLAEHARLLELAARLVGEEFERGGRPILLTREVTRTTIASVDALASLIEDGSAPRLTDVGEDEALTEEQLIGSGLGGLASLQKLEDRVDAALFPHPEVVPDQVLQLVVAEKLAHAERDVERVLDTLPREGSPFFVIAGDELARASHEALAQARALHRAANDRESLAFLREVRDIVLWLRSEALAVRVDVPVDPDTIVRTEKILNTLERQGLVTSEDRQATHERLRRLLGGNAD